MSSTASAAKSRNHLVADEKVLVLDFGSQYAQLIARRVREEQVYCEIVRHSTTAKRIAELRPKGIILSGGPASVYENAAPKCDPEIFRLGIPVLGICYGMQLACEVLGGKVSSAPAREYGRAQVPDHFACRFVRGCVRRNGSLDESRRPSDASCRPVRAALRKPPLARLRP